MRVATYFQPSKLTTLRLEGEFLPEAIGCQWLDYVSDHHHSHTSPHDAEIATLECKTFRYKDTLRQVIVEFLSSFVQRA